MGGGGGDKRERGGGGGSPLGGVIVYALSNQARDCMDTGQRGTGGMWGGEGLGTGNDMGTRGAKGLAV